MRKPIGLLMRMLGAFFLLLGLSLAEEGDKVVAQEFGDTGAATRTILILDASNSMWGKVDGKHKIEIAREVAVELVKDLPENIELGLMAYGHRKAGDCKDIELLVAPGEGSREEIVKQIEAITPRGMTPLTASVEQAADILKFTEAPGSVILVTDGIESCDGDLDGLAKKLADQGLAFQANVIGFDLADANTEGLQNLAKATGGIYLDADNADELRAALQEAGKKVSQVEAEPEPEKEPKGGLELSAVDADGNEIGKGVEYAIYLKGEEEAAAKESGGKVSWDGEAGEYVVVAEFNGISQEADLAIEAGERAEHVFAFSPARVSAVARLAEGEDVVEKSLSWSVFAAERDPKDKHLKHTYSAKPTFELEPGDYELVVTHADSRASKKFTLADGEQLELEVVFGSGVLAPTLIYTEGGEEVDGNLSWTVYETKQDLKGNRKKVSHSYSKTPTFTIEGGEYLLDVRVGEASAQQEITLSAGERLEPVLVLEAGLLALKSMYSEGGEAVDKCSWTVFEAKKDLKGNRKRIGHSYSSAVTFTVPAGDYVVTLTSGLANAEGQITVEAGAMNELALSLEAGILAVETTVAEGGEREKSARLYVLEAEANIKGERKQLARDDISSKTGHEYLLPAGKYQVSGVNGKGEAVEKEVEVKAGARTEETLELPKITEED